MQRLLLIIAGVVVTGRCFQGYRVTLEQVGSNVVATGSGALDLTGLTGGPDSYKPVINASDASIATGGSPATLETGPRTATDTYQGGTGPANFGPGGLVRPDSASGDLVGVFGNGYGENDVFIFVPQGYKSEPLSSSATWNNVTLATLGKGLPWLPSEGDGVTPGAYVWTWGTGAKQNFTLTIGPTSGWWWLKACYWPFHFRYWPFHFRFPDGGHRQRGRRRVNCQGRPRVTGN